MESGEIRILFLFRQSTQAWAALINPEKNFCLYNTKYEQNKKVFDCTKCADLDSKRIKEE